MQKIKNLGNLLPDCEIHPLIIDEEFWCFKPDVLDLIVSSSHLHWVNNISVVFSRFLESLQPDGVLLGIYTLKIYF